MKRRRLRANRPGAVVALEDCVIAPLHCRADAATEAKRFPQASLELGARGHHLEASLKALESSAFEQTGRARRVVALERGVVATADRHARETSQGRPRHHGPQPDLHSRGRRQGRHQGRGQGGRQGDRAQIDPREAVGDEP